MLKRLSKIFIILITFYVVSLTFIYSITPQILIHHTNNGLETIKSETLYPKYFFNNNNATTLDNFTDKVMLDRIIAQNANDTSLEQAMYMNGYSRYWHGYQIILRPLLVLFNYFEIRYINTFISFALLFKALNIIKKRVNNFTCWSFFVAVMSTKFFIVPMSLQFSNMMLLMLLTIILSDKILYSPTTFNPQTQALNCEKYYIFAFVLGSITVFLDLLTTPILPIGILLLLSFLHYYEKYKYLLPNKFIFYTFIFWGIGYVGTWAMKWILATVICSQNIILNAFNQIIFRVAGDGAKYEVHRLSMLESNIKMLFQPFGHTSKIIIISLLVIICAFLLYKYKKPHLNKLFTKKLIFISLTPYFWYLMAANHSQIHSWFTYRSQIITVVGFSYLVFYLVDWQKFNFKLKGKFKCLK